MNAFGMRLRWIDPRHPRLAAALLVEVLLLAVQYVAGMYLNLYASIPPMTGGSGVMSGGMWAFMSSSAMPALMFHMMNAVLLVLIALLVVAGSILARERSLAAMSGLGLLGILIALWSGLAFLFSQQDVYSLGMALGFLLALTMGVWALALAWKGSSSSTARLISPPAA